MMYTRFYDMHSGGGQKTDYATIYIEAAEEDAKNIFLGRFHRNPDQVTCNCCGEDFAYWEVEAIDSDRWELPALIIDKHGRETVLERR